MIERFGIPGLAGFILAHGLMLAQSTLPPGTSSGDAPAAQSSEAGPVAQAEDKISLQDYEAAHALLLPWISAHPQDARAWFDLGYVEDAQNHLDAAATDYRKAIAADPKQFEARLSLGLLLARTDHSAESIEQLRAATGLDPNPPNPGAKAQAYRALARLERTSDPAAARQDLLQALQLGPEAPADALLTAEIAAANEDDETAEAAYRRVLAKNPESSEATAGLVHLLLKQKKYTEAEPLLRSALKRDPDDPALNSQLASLLAAEGKKEEAMAVLEKLRQVKPEDPLIAEMLADAYAQAGQPEKAEPIYAELVQKTPKDPGLLVAHGENLLHLQQYDEAVMQLQEGLKRKPDDAEGWTELAIAASEAHQYSIALQALSTREKYAEETPGSYFLWATTYDNLHLKKQAVEYYQKFLSSANGKFPDQEWQAQHRLIALGEQH